jgi:hypothetical protein
MIVMQEIDRGVTGVEFFLEEVIFEGGWGVAHKPRPACAKALRSGVSHLGVDDRGLLRRPGQVREVIRSHTCAGCTHPSGTILFSSMGCPPGAQLSGTGRSAGYCPEEPVELRAGRWAWRA